MEHDFKLYRRVKIESNSYLETGLALLVLGGAGWFATTMASWASAF